MNRTHCQVLRSSFGICPFQGRERKNKRTPIHHYYPIYMHNLYIYIRVCALRLSTCLIMMSQKRAKTSNTIACKCGVCLSTRRPFSDKTSSYKQWFCWYWHFMLKTNSFCSGFTKQPFKRICPFGSINWSNWEKIILTTWGRAEDFINLDWPKIWRLGLLVLRPKHWGGGNCQVQ